jgi:hypothetical protein
MKFSDFVEDGKEHFILYKFDGIGYDFLHSYYKLSNIIIKTGSYMNIEEAYIDLPYNDGELKDYKKIFFKSKKELIDEFNNLKILKEII